MIKEFELKGLDCPHCSAEIEAEAGRLGGVESAGVNLIRQTLTMEVSEYKGNLFDDIEKIVHKHEPDVVVSEKKRDTDRIKSFILEGLDCPHCMAEIEEKVDRLAGVERAEINLMKQILTVEAPDYNGDLFADIEKIVHKHEPDVAVYEVSEKNSIDNNAGKAEKKADKREKSNAYELIRLGIGAAVYAVGFAAVHFSELPLYAELAVLIAAYIILGGDVVLRAVRNILKGRVFDENFLMTVSTVSAFAIGEYSEAVAVMLFYQIGEYFQNFAVRRSRKSISELMDIRPDYANVERNGRIQTVSPEEIEIGEKIIVKPGEKIPLDGIVLDGESMLDTRALTGESVPRSTGKGDTVLSGCVNQSGVIAVEVTKAFSESTASKIIDLVENAAGRKAPAENFITKFSRYYTPAVVICALLLAVIPPLAFGGAWAEWIKRGCVFLVISCPCALVISIPLTFFGAIGAASKKGVLVKGGNYLELLDKIDMIIFDKTGTLTKGVFRVSDIIPAEGFTKEQVLEYAAKAESLSNHPIAKSVRSAYGKDFDNNIFTDYREISGHGVIVKADGAEIAAGNEKAMNMLGVDFERTAKAGTRVYIAVDGKFAGCVIISDEIKEDGAKAISELRKLGVRRTVMLTGDNKEIAADVAEKLDIDEFYAELLPGDKVDILERLNLERKSGGVTAFVGDGINDAPSLARADVGIAMGGLGSDAAIEAADVVLMTDELSKLAEAVRTAKATKGIVTQNIVFALGIKGIFLILGALGIAGMWIAVFGDVGVMLIAVINAMRVMKK